MERVRFGKTELMVSKFAFGGIPIMRISTSEAVEVIRGAISLGVNFIDTANGYADSEEKIGHAIKGMPRDSVVLATKSMAKDKKTFLEHLDLSLNRLGTDYIDIFQIHNVATQEAYDAVFSPEGSYQGLVEAVKAGKVRFPAFTSHNIPMAIKIIGEKDFSSVQLPLNYVDDLALKEAIPLAKERDMGFMAMKPFGGGKLDDANLMVKYFMQFDSVIPTPGIEKLGEIEEIIKIAKSGDKIIKAELEAIEKIRSEVEGVWCHRCDYCLPCPQKINISVVLNAEGFMRRMTYARAIGFLKQNMENAKSCTRCYVCAKRCPYNLDIPELIKAKLPIWDEFLATEK